MTGKRFDLLAGQLGLSRKDVSELTDIPLPTLHAWATRPERPALARDLRRTLLELCAVMRQRIETVEREVRE